MPEAEARGRPLYANPRVSYSRESAGFTEFFQAEQTLPVTGRLQLLRFPRGRPVVASGKLSTACSPRKSGKPSITRD